MPERMNNPAHLPRRCLTIAMLIGAWLLLASCGQAVNWGDSADSSPQRTTQQSEKRSSRGNPPFYEVFGQRYYVLDSSDQFKERGVASWYGKKFHGKQTSSGVIYDMHAMTAAHKTLPLPTKVRVRNLKNGRSIIVTVNDRGPFIDNRIIDLSYAAATRLDMVGAGTALVEIEALQERDQLPGGEVAVLATTGQDLPVAQPATVKLYLQVGAFGDQSNAQRLVDRLHGSGFGSAAIRSETTRVPPIFRVRLGPVNDVTEYDELVKKMAALEIVNTHLVTESRGVPSS